MYLPLIFINPKSAARWAENKNRKYSRSLRLLSKEQFQRWEEEMRIALIISLLLTGIDAEAAWHSPSPEMQVLVDGVPISTYYHNGTTYLEAIKGREYVIRLSNPSGSRVAVALSVDGLNTIDARHTEARLGSKWVLEPYHSIAISGWQTNARQARHFFFTTEDRSYGARLKNTENLGIISAVFFRERIHPVQWPMPHLMEKPKGSAQSDAAGTAAESQPQRNEVSKAMTSQPEYAATGIGDRVRHEVQPVYMELEDKPFAALNLRYEFRPVLVKLGVIPPLIKEDPLSRRERAKGFREASYCPEP